MRIAIGGLAHETNTFSTLPTTYADFALVRGPALIETPFWQRVAAEGHELAPLLVAHATPSGRVTAPAFQRLLGELLDGLAASLPLDGLLLILHGAMEVEEIGDGETAILTAVRDLVGPEPFLAVTLDLHANLAQAVVQRSDLITAYRTAPHRDAQETRERAARLMLDCLRQGLRPTCHLVKLPLLVAGEAAVTEVEPARSLYSRLPEIAAVPGVLDASILVGCAWTDSPETGMGVVVCGTDQKTVIGEAERLASEVWAARDRFRIDVPTATIDEAIRMAYRATERPVFISDSGDNPTAGAAGDSPNVLRQLVGMGAEEALVAGIADPAAVERCFDVGEGGKLALEIGGRLDYTFAAPYPAQVTVKRLVEGNEKTPPRALVRIGGVDLVLHSNRRSFTELGYFREMDIGPTDYKLIVVKLGYLLPELRDYAPRHIMALSPGYSDQRIERLPYYHLRRPIYPLDPGIAWTPAEAAS